VDDEKFFNLYPFRKCEFKENDGIVTVLFKKEKPSFIEKIFFRKQLDIPYKIDLDNVGSFIYKICDGKFSVSQIAEEAEKEFGDKIVPADKRVKLFIEQMNKNKLIQLFEKK